MREAKLMKRKPKKSLSLFQQHTARLKETVEAFGVRG